MSQETSPSLSSNNIQYTFGVPAGFGLLDEDFELPEEQISQDTTQQTFPLRVLPTGNNVPPFLNPYSPTSPNDPSISPNNSRYYYHPPPTYFHHPYYNPMCADPESFSKFIAEEDKRRRNTAASARFRIKKKMREQALEKTARDMSAKAEMLENRVKELEKEIKWLKNLLIEKESRTLNNGNKDGVNNEFGKSDQQHQK